MAWTPGGDEVGSRAGRPGARDIRALSLTGRHRLVLPARPAELHDVQRTDSHSRHRERPPREISSEARNKPERNLSWLDWSFLTGFSPDGSRVLFEERSRTAKRANGGCPQRARPRGATQRRCVALFYPLGCGSRAPPVPITSRRFRRVGTGRRISLADCRSGPGGLTPDGKQMMCGE